MSHQRELDAVALLRAVGEGVAVFAHDGTPVLVNDRLRRLVGDERADGGFPPRWWPQDEEELLREAVRTARGDGAVLQGEFTLTRADGSDLVAHVTWDVARDGSDTPVAIVATVQDMTERLLVEEAWMEARRTYELLSANSTDVVARMSSGMRLLYLSPSVTRVLGFPVNRLMGQSVLSFIHPDDLAVARASHEQLVRGADAVTTTVRVRHADGRWVWMEAISHALRGERGELIETQCSARNISKRRAAEERSRQIAEELGFVARHAGDMISAHDADGRYRMVSDASRTLLGRAPDSLIDTSPLDTVHPEDRDEVAAVLARVAGGQAFVESMTHRAVRPDGSTLWLDTSVRPILGDDGRLSAFICVSRDATARMVVEREASDRARRSEREAVEQTALRRVAMAVANQSNAEPVMAMVADELPRLLDVAGGLVVRFTPAGGVVAAASEGLPWLAGDPVLVADRSALELLRDNGRTARASAPLVFPDGTIITASTVASPVRVDEDVWGAVVAVGRHNTTVPAGAESRLERFAELVSVAIVAADTRELLAAQALSDPLTGLANHRAFHERLRAEVARARRYDRPLALAVIDIDHFKRLNDLHGHQTGDSVLAGLAGLLARTARAGELVARVGGEEFAWLLPETDGATATQAVERFRAAVAAAPLWQTERTTVSAGVSDLLHARDADELFRLADGALYWAKNNGRDQVCRYSPEVVESLSVEERAQRLERTQTLIALRSLARAVDAKDTSTKAHSERVAALSHRLALGVGWSRDRAALLRDAALLHDVGKLGVPDAVLFKAGDLNAAEYETVKRHATLGADITADALSVEQCGWIRHHHEHWDGRGYPDGISGEDIPEGARIIAVADAWDVMTRARHYGTVRSVEEALVELDRCTGHQFWAPAAEAMQRLARSPRAVSGL